MMEKDDSKSTSGGATGRGNKVGALVLVGVNMSMSYFYSF